MGAILASEPADFQFRTTDDANTRTQKLEILRQAFTDSQPIGDIGKVTSMAELTAIENPTPDMVRFVTKQGKRRFFIFDPADYSSPFLIPHEDNVGQTVADLGDHVYRTGKAATVTADYEEIATASQLVDGFELWARRVDGNFFFFGVDASEGIADYNTLDFAVGPGQGVLYANINGANDTVHPATTPTDWYGMVRLPGSDTIKVYTNPAGPTLAGATLKHTFSAACSGPVYPKVLGYVVGTHLDWLIKDTSSTGNGLVSADIRQGIVAAPDFDPSGKSGAWAAILDGNLRLYVDWFINDGETNASAALRAAAGVMRILGAAILSFTPSKEYIVGEQEASTLNDYSWRPLDILNLGAFEGSFLIEGNGAKLKAADGLKFGAFNPGGGGPAAPALPFSNTAYLASPYEGMIRAEGYTGLLVIDDLVCDGNMAGLDLGGEWGDTGYQIKCAGLQIWPAPGGRTRMRTVTSHHHGTDGITFRGLVDSKGEEGITAILSDVTCNWNGRNGFSLTGGRGIIFERLTCNHNAKGPIATNPAYGFDNEPDNALYTDNITFINPEMMDNLNGGYGAGSGRISNVLIINPRFEDGGGTGYAFWLDKPGHVFQGGKIVGKWRVAAWDDQFGRGILEDGATARFHETLFTNRALEFYAGVSPVYAVGVYAQSDSDDAVFSDCIFDYGEANNLEIGGVGDFHNGLFYGNLAGVSQFDGKLYGRTRRYSDPASSTNAQNSLATNCKSGTYEWNDALIYTSAPRCAGIKTRGDVSVALVAGTDKETQLFNTALTANRTVTLPLTAAEGDSYRVTRTGGGAFNLDVGGLKTLTANQWARVAYAGGWNLVEAGAL